MLCHNLCIGHKQFVFCLNVYSVTVCVLAQQVCHSFCFGAIRVLSFSFVTKSLLSKCVFLCTQLYGDGNTYNTQDITYRSLLEQKKS